MAGVQRQEVEVAHRRIGRVTLRLRSRVAFVDLLPRRASELRPVRVRERVVDGQHQAIGGAEAVERGLKRCPHPRRSSPAVRVVAEVDVLLADAGDRLKVCWIWKTSFDERNL